jgi:hypothetical protein
VQTTAAGAAIAIGGLIRDAMLLSPDGQAGSAAAYVPVFALEAALLVLALCAVWPLIRQQLDPAQDNATSRMASGAAAREGLAGTKI